MLPLLDRGYGLAEAVEPQFVAASEVVGPGLLEDLDGSMVLTGLARGRQLPHDGGHPGRDVGRALARPLDFVLQVGDRAQAVQQPPVHQPGVALCPLVMAGRGGGHAERERAADDHDHGGRECRLTQERQWSVFGRDGITSSGNRQVTGLSPVTFAARPIACVRHVEGASVWPGPWTNRAVRCIHQGGIEGMRVAKSLVPGLTFAELTVVSRLGARPPPHDLGRATLTPGTAGPPWGRAPYGRIRGGARPGVQVTTRQELVAALNDGVYPPPSSTPSNAPKIIYVDGTIDANVDDNNQPLTCEDYCRDG